MADSLYSIDPTPSKVTRVRPQLSCIPCRQGKLKCNRAQPACDQCVKRSRESACNYVPPPPKDRGRKAKDMRGRIKHLESLVVDLMNGKVPPQQATSASAEQSFSGGTPPENGSREVAPGFTGDVKTPHSASGDEEGHCASAFGQMRISEEETAYTGSSHWTAILHDVGHLESPFLTILEAEEDNEEMGGTSSERSEENRSHSALIVGSPPTVTREELLNNLPPKATADRLVALWYSSQDPTLPQVSHEPHGFDQCWLTYFPSLLHGPTFQAHYRQFWKHPYSTPPMFIALLYGILSLATIYSSRGAASESPLTSESAVRDAERYRTLAASAAVLADYAKPKPYTLETLLIYGESEFLCGGGTPMEVWLIMGVIVRLALRMGYHRDPRHYGNISPFDGEMRRRVWHLTWQLDVLLSFTLGLPSTVRGFQSDAEPPRNLLDQDFSVNSRELPPARPPSELTPVSYCLAKTRVCAVFAAAADASHSVTAPTYPEIMELDRRLEEAHSLVPPALRLRPLEQALSDPQELIMHRFNVELLYQKTRCVLHRTYLVKAHDDTRFQYSRTACLDAAKKLLNHQGTIFYACQPGGQLSRVKWYFSSLTSHDFLLAAMVVCLELNLRHETRNSADSPNPQQEDLIGTWELLKALETSSSIWESYEAKLIDSGEAKKAAKAFRAIL
ncbi:hypothetical protein K490DRAFT_33868, partial [Saccharata proteae CBS 121410]